MLRCAIIINAYYNETCYLKQASRLKEELERQNVQTDIIRNNAFLITVNSSGKLENSLKGYDFCVYFDKDKYVLSGLEKSGIKVFNNNQAIQDCDDKAQTILRLSNAKIPMPKTLFGLLCYDKNGQISDKTLDIIEKELNYPIIIKESYGSQGKGVYKADNRESLEKIANDVKLKPHLFQEFIKSSAGKDIRVIVIGGKVIASMMRQSQKDFRSNLGVGGIASPYTANKELQELCKKVAKILQLDYCGIDVLLGENENEYYICEVNSNAFFDGIEACTQINVAKAYAEYLVKKVQK